ncbi:hypothetical protein AB4499_15825 [Vibrio cyclitrophicus]
MNNKVYSQNLEIISGYLMLFFSFFFYVSPINTGLDTQPYSIFFATIYFISCILNNREVPSYFILLFVFLIIVVLLGYVDFYFFDGGFEVIRGVVNYFAACIYIVAFYIFFQNNKFPTKFLIGVIFIYVLIAFIQFFIDANIFASLVHVRTTTDRGVTSLTPEPTFFGVVLYLFLLLNTVNTNISEKNRIILSALLIFSILFLARSSMVVIYIGLFFLAIFCQREIFRGISLIIITSFLTYLSLVYIADIVNDNSIRVLKLLKVIMENGILVILNDASINDRVGQVYLAILGFYSNYALPGLFTTFEYYTHNKSILTDGLFWFGDASNKVISFWGAYIYELGFLSLVFFIFLYFFMRGKRNLVFISIALFIPLWGGVTVANPLVYMVIVYAIEKGKHDL